MERIDHLDNAKGVLVLAVIVGHLFWPIPPDARTHEVAYAWIYLFHMPTFALVSGYLSSREASWRRFARLVNDLLLPLAVFTALQVLLQVAYGLEPKPLDGLFGLWYLFSLFCWRLLLLVFGRHWFGLILALLLALAAGFAEWIGFTLSASRTLVLFPVFLLGYFLSSAQVILKTAVRPLVALVVLLLLGTLVWFLSDGSFHLYALFYHAHPYPELGLSGVAGPVVRLIILVAAVSAGLSLLGLIPVGNSLLTRWGRNSLTIYLLHSPLLQVYREHPVVYENVNALPLGVILIVGAAVTGVLGSSIVKRASHWLVHPRPGILFGWFKSQTSKSTRGDRQASS